MASIDQKPSANVADQEAPEDRRKSHQIRIVFEQAYTIALPFIDPARGVGGQPMVRHAYPALMEAFPMLTMQDIACLVPAIERVFKERNKSGI